MMTTDFTAQSTATVSTEDTAALQAIWEQIDANTCPHYYNFHMHTICSDGQLKPEEVIQQALENHLQGLAITDHHTVEGYKIANNYLQNCGEEAHTLPQLWTGVEITSILLDTEVHILGYGFDPQHPAIVPYLQESQPRGESAQAEAVIAAIHQAGGLVVLAHPERYLRSGEVLIPQAVELGIDGVETYYAYKNPTPWKPSPQQTAKVKALSDQYSLYDTCGTDTHGLSILQRI